MGVNLWEDLKKCQIKYIISKVNSETSIANQGLFIASSEDKRWLCVNYCCIVGAKDRLKMCFLNAILVVKVKSTFLV